MARYKLLAPHYLGTRYYAEGSVVDWDGPPSQQMEGADAAGKKAVEVRDNPRKEASEVPTPGGEPADSTWAPQTRAAFTVKRLRKPNPNDPDDQATIVREAASPPSASAPVANAGAPREAEIAGETRETANEPRVPRKNRVRTAGKK